MDSCQSSQFVPHWDNMSESQRANEAQRVVDEHEAAEAATMAEQACPDPGPDPSGLISQPGAMLTSTGEEDKELDSDSDDGDLCEFRRLMFKAQREWQERIDEINAAHVAPEADEERGRQRHADETFREDEEETRKRSREIPDAEGGGPQSMSTVSDMPVHVGHVYVPISGVTGNVMYNAMATAAVRILATSRGLSTVGEKAILVQRLLFNDAAEQARASQQAATGAFTQQAEPERPRPQEAKREAILTKARAGNQESSDARVAQQTAETEVKQAEEVKIQESSDARIARNLARKQGEEERQNRKGAGQNSPRKRVSLDEHVKHESDIKLRCEAEGYAYVPLSYLTDEEEDEEDATGLYRMSEAHGRIEQDIQQMVTTEAEKKKKRRQEPPSFVESDECLICCKRIPRAERVYSGCCKHWACKECCSNWRTECAQSSRPARCMHCRRISSLVS